jgi:hypothetical protein
VLLFSLFDATYFGFFYKAIIRQYEIPKESRSCTVQRLYRNVQLRSQLYKQVYFKFTVVTLWGWWVLWIMMNCDYIFGQSWWPYSEVTPALWNNTNYNIVISVSEFKQSELPDIRCVKVKHLYQNVLDTKLSFVKLHSGNHSFIMFLMLFNMSII